MENLNDRERRYLVEFIKIMAEVLTGTADDQAERGADPATLEGYDRALRQLRLVKRKLDKDASPRL